MQNPGWLIYVGNVGDEILYLLLILEYEIAPYAKSYFEATFCFIQWVAILTVFFTPCSPLNQS